MRALKWTLIVLAVGIGALIAYSYHLSRPVFDESWAPVQPTVPARTDALTFARSRDALLLVVGHGDGEIQGIDLTAMHGGAATADLIDFYLRVGYAPLASLGATTVSVPLDALIQPYAYRPPFVAVGTNYAEHAAEVDLDDPPFLFPKLAAPTNWNSAVRYVDRLDYEAELCLVPLADITQSVADVDYGLVLCNDFTDRWTLVRELDLGQPMGLTGFAAAKGRATFLPTGYLFVIPRTPAFYESVTLELFVDDRLRQRFRAGDMILKPRDIVAQSFAQLQAPYVRGDEPVKLIPQGLIPKGTLILTGTAGGVMFRTLNIWNQGFYLAPGAVVRTRAKFLGELSNRVER